MFAAPLSPHQLADIARRFEAAHARSDISALAILAVETIPALLTDARLAAGQRSTLGANGAGEPSAPRRSGDEPRETQSLAKEKEA